MVSVEGEQARRYAAATNVNDEVRYYTYVKAERQAH